MTMATAKLSAHDKKDLDKFTKFLAMKAIQIIVQARLGEKIKTKSKAFSSGADWFNLAVKDMPEVVNESKKVLHGQLPTVGNPICVEISLRTVDGDAMVLEYWYLGVTDECDSNTRVTYTVYNRMGIMLKSLLTTTRVTPAYKLSRRQGSDSYVVCYRLFFGEPNLQCLGDGHQTKKVGGVGTPVGNLNLTLAYRTKMTLTPQKCEKETMLVKDMKDDHFKPDCSPKRTPKPCLTGYHCESRGNVADEIAEALSQCEDCNTLFSTSPNADVAMAHATQHHQHLQDDRGTWPQNDCIEKQQSFSKLRKIGAFVQGGDLQTETTDFILPENAFNSLLQHDDAAIRNRNGELYAKQPDRTGGVDDERSHQCEDDHGLHKSAYDLQSVAEDYVMVDLKAPFAVPDASNELTTFIRECQAAPTLASFNDPQGTPELEDLKLQLDAFELNADVFDDFVNTLQQVEG